MCEKGKEIKVTLAQPDYRGCSVASVDECIAPLVAALNDGGIETEAASCCGHGKTRGSIVLKDGRELVIREFPYPYGEYPTKREWRLEKCLRDLQRDIELVLRRGIVLGMDVGEVGSEIQMKTEVWAVAGEIIKTRSVKIK